MGLDVSELDRAAFECERGAESGVVGSDTLRDVACVAHIERSAGAAVDVDVVHAVPGGKRWDLG